jgi:outer membrane protein
MTRFYILILICITTAAHAQQRERLTLQDAIAKALEHNFDIRMSKAAAEQAAANNTLGNAGMLPNLYGTGAAQVSTSTTHIELAAGGIQNKDNAKATSIGSAINLNWTLFDGGRMFIARRRFEELEKLGDLNFKAQLQQTVADVVQAYALIVYQQQQVVAIDTGLVLARVRMELSNAKFETGVSPKTDYLQARVDYNARQSDSMNQVAQLSNSYGTLNVLMGDDADKTWLVDDSVHSDVTLQPQDRERLKEINFSLAAARSYADASRLNAKIQKGALLPTLAANGAYNFARNTSETGFAFLNQAVGPTGSLNLTIPVFMGGNLRRQYKVASLQAFADELQYEKQNTDFGRQYRTAWSNYRVSVGAYYLETENIRYAKENLDIQKARFQVGIATTLEERQAEVDYVTALVRLYTATYNLKLNETKVLQLENGLVK